MSLILVLALAFAIGCVSGLRSMTAPALVCWAAHLGWIDLSGSHLEFLGRVPAVAIFSLLAIAELVADKLPNIPGRNTPGPLAARFLFGGLSGAALGIAGHASWLIGFLVGGIGGIAGGLGGYTIRRELKRHFKLPDFPVAIAEDLIAIVGGIFIVSRF